MGRGRQRRARFSSGEQASLVIELFAFIVDAVRLLVRLPMMLLRLFD